MFVYNLQGLLLFSKSCAAVLHFNFCFLKNVSQQPWCDSKVAIKIFKNNNNEKKSTFIPCKFEKTPANYFEVICFTFGLRFILKPGNVGSDWIRRRKDASVVTRAPPPPLYWAPASSWAWLEPEPAQDWQWRGSWRRLRISPHSNLRSRSCAPDPSSSWFTLSCRNSVLLFPPQNPKCKLRYIRIQPRNISLAYLILPGSWLPCSSPATWNALISPRNKNRR